MGDHSDLDLETVGVGGRRFRRTQATRAKSESQASSHHIILFEFEAKNFLH